MLKKDTLQVKAIKSGVVIDHIPAGIGYKLLEVFRFIKMPHQPKITVGINLPSKKIKIKDIIKIENVDLQEEETAKLAIYCPKSTINRIKDYKVIDKIKPPIISSIEGSLVCPNPNCITHVEAVSYAFKVLSYDKDTLLKCKYCEMVFHKEVVLNQCLKSL